MINNEPYKIAKPKPFTVSITSPNYRFHTGIQYIYVEIVKTNNYNYFLVDYADDATIPLKPR